MIFQPNLFIVPSPGPIVCRICFIIERSILKSKKENLTIHIIKIDIGVCIQSFIFEGWLIAEASQRIYLKLEGEHNIWFGQRPVDFVVSRITFYGALWTTTMCMRKKIFEKVNSK